MRPNPFEKASRKHFEFFEVLLSLTSSLIRFGNSETLGTRFRERRFSGARKLAHHVRVSLCYDIAIDTRATDAGSLVTWNVTSDMGFNPVFRIFGLFMDRMLGKTYELGLKNIADLA